jgi:Cation efflux family
MAPRFSLSTRRRLLIVLCLSSSFLAAELVIGFTTHSLAIIADAFHYLGDILSLLVAYLADKVLPPSQFDIHLPSVIMRSHERARDWGSRNSNHHCTGIVSAADKSSCYCSSLQIVFREHIPRLKPMVVAGRQSENRSPGHGRYRINRHCLPWRLSSILSFFWVSDSASFCRAWHGW